MHLYTEDQISALPEISHEDAQRVYKVRAKDCYIVVDNKNGLGEVPDNRNVLYKGFVVHMRPEKFLQLCKSSADVATRAKELGTLMRTGTAIGNPFLEIDVLGFFDHENYSLAKVRSHEGRARVQAMLDLGVVNMPVHVFLAQGYRSRDVKDAPDFVDYLQAGIFCEGTQGEIIKKALVGKVLF